MPEPPSSGWALTFEQTDGTNGALRLAPAAADATGDGVRWAYWAYVDLGTGGFVIVRDDEVVPPRRDTLLEVRTDSLWAELVCEVPGEHWSFGLETFGLRLDDRAEARIATVGERLPLGFDLEWDEGCVFGELLVARARIPFDGRGELTPARETSWADWIGEGA
jgi:hypothetical protein